MKMFPEMFNKHRYFWKILLFTLLLFAFCYFRLKPIYFQIVPYTYDQGRDFLKAQEIALYKNPTFIGPTTGVMGLYHGAWWYYFLSAAFLFFNGAPTGFYLSIFILQLVSTLLFFKFLKQEVNEWIAYIFLGMVTLSSYFIGVSFFAANNILTPPTILLFIYSVYMFLKHKRPLHLFLLGLSMGFVFETEVSFGLFIIPATALVSLLFSEFRSLLKKPVQLLYFFGGLVIPFIPRLLFEVKNGFMQTKTIMLFLNNPTAHHPQTLYGAFQDRLKIFSEYIQEIFYGNTAAMIYVSLVFVALAVFLAFRTKQDSIKKSLYFFVLLSVVLFTITVFYKNNFFWKNYVEGIQYIFVMIILLCLQIFSSIKHRMLLIIVTLILAGLTCYKLSYELKPQRDIPAIGLREDIATVSYLYNKVGNNDFCLRIYTPPIVPYTYDYLLDYYERTQGHRQYITEYVQGKCWYIIDKDQYAFRVKEWLEKNAPPNSKVQQSVRMENGTVVELRSL